MGRPPLPDKRKRVLNYKKKYRDLNAERLNAAHKDKYWARKNANGYCHGQNTIRMLEREEEGIRGQVQGNPQGGNQGS